MLKYVALVWCWAASAQASYSVISSSDTVIGSFTRTDTVVQDGSNTQNRFVMSRLRKTSGTLQGPVLLMPGGSANFSLYERPQTSGGFTSSFAGHLANEDYDVWGYSPRSQQFASGDCSVGTTCDVMADWGMATIVADAEYIRSKIEDIWDTTLPAVGGFSLGAISTFAVVDSNPSAYSGALIWEGLLYTEDAEIESDNETICAEYSEMVSLGEVSGESVFFAGGSTIGDLQFIVDNTSDPVRHLLLYAGTTTPEQPPLSYVPDYILLKGNGDIWSPDFSYADENVLIDALTYDFNAYESNVVTMDIACSLAGSETSFTDDLSSFTEPVFVAKTSYGLGPYMQDTIDLFGTSSGDFTTVTLTGYGHADSFLTASRASVLENDVVDWLDGIYP